METFKTLDSIAADAAERCFTPSYKAITPLADRKLDGLGIVISQWTKWNGLAIMKIAAAALEDANWHAEAKCLFDKIEAMEKEMEENEE